MRHDLTIIQVAAVRDMLRDELLEDERLYLDTLEGETDLYELTRRLFNKIEADEGDGRTLATQIADREARKVRAAERVKANRKAIMALIDCAGLDKITLPEATFSVRDIAAKAIVTNESAVPEEFTKIKRSPDMAAIKAEVEAGRAVPGVTLDNGGRSLTIRRK